MLVIENITKKFNEKIISIIQIILGIILCSVSAKIVIPIKPIPITLQTSAVILIAMCYPTKEVMYTIIGYVALGFIGAPIFTSKFGLIALRSESAGYILGFILSSYVITRLRTKHGDQGWIKLAIYTSAGTLAIFLSGILYLSFLLGSFRQAIIQGFLPFIVSGIIKIILTTCGIKIIKRNH